MRKCTSNKNAINLQIQHSKKPYTTSEWTR